MFFENTRCDRCGKLLGFDPITMSVLALTGDANGELAASEGITFRHCRNRLDFDACNWLLPTGETNNYCQACRLNDVIPDLGRADNIVLWRRLELAKRRLLYTLLALGLPLGPTSTLPGMRFRFLEDRSRNPDVTEEFVSTGHAGGVITLNLAEADHASRQQVQEQMHERYRTLLGHFRHESGHYYYPALLAKEADLAVFRYLFGDERAPYDASIQAYYESGPPVDWERVWVSAYASAHPLEDWAESFAHYLHIVDALETARELGAMGKGVAPDGKAGWILQWGELSVFLNELNRGLGLEDPYPFVLPPSAVRRLDFIYQLVGRHSV